MSNSLETRSKFEHTLMITLPSIYSVNQIDLKIVVKLRFSVEFLIRLASAEKTKKTHSPLAFTSFAIKFFYPCDSRPRQDYSMGITLTYCVPYVLYLFIEILSGDFFP